MMHAFTKLHLVTLGEFLHILHAIAPTYHEYTNLITASFIPKKYSLSLAITPLRPMQLFGCGMLQWLCCLPQHALSTMCLEFNYPRGGELAITGCAWLEHSQLIRHPTARPQFSEYPSLNTKSKTASLPINAAFCCGGLHAIKRKILLRNEGCMPSLFPFT